MQTAVFNSSSISSEEHRKRIEADQEIKSIKTGKEDLLKI